MRFNPNINASVVDNIQLSDQSLQTAYQQVSTGFRVNQPSDDPGASYSYIQLQAQSANIDQFTTNANTAVSQAQTADGVLTSVVSLLTQAVSYGTAGANSTYSATQKQDIANNVLGILKTVVSDANTQFEGQPLFGGTATGPGGSAITPYTLDPTTTPPTYTYHGNTGVNNIPIADTLAVQGNIPGSTLFENSNGNVLKSLTDLATALQSGTTADIGAATSAVTSALNYVSSQHSVYGNTINLLNSQDAYLAQEKITLTSSENSLVGIDSATAAENLAQAETSNATVLAAAGKVIQNSLLNYLK